jgi:signal transduction histidine kinase
MFENLLKNAIRHNNNKKQISITLTKDFLKIRNSTDKLPDFSKIFDLFYKEKSS